MQSGDLLRRCPLAACRLIGSQWNRLIEDVSIPCLETSLGDDIHIDSEELRERELDSTKVKDARPFRHEHEGGRTCPTELKLGPGFIRSVPSVRCQSGPQLIRGDGRLAASGFDRVHDAEARVAGEGSVNAHPRRSLLDGQCSEERIGHLVAPRFDACVQLSEDPPLALAGLDPDRGG